LKTWNFITKLAAAIFLLCAGVFSFAQDKRFSRIPDAAALVVKLDLEKLNSSPAFGLLADHGELAAIRDELKQIPWTENGAIPDPVIVYAPELGSGFVMLIDTDRSPKDIAGEMAEQTEDGKTVEFERYPIGHTITLKQSVTDRKKRQHLETEARIIFLSSGVAAFGRNGSPLSARFCTAEQLPDSEFAKLQTTPADVLAAGIMRSFPVPASDDPTGLSALVKTGEFTISEQESGDVSFVLAFECKGEQEAAQAARRMKSFARIALFSLFASDKDLFKELDAACRTTAEGTGATLELKLPMAAVEKVLAFYGIMPKRHVPMAVPATKQEAARK